MAIVAYRILLPTIRVAACTVLFNVLRLSRGLDRTWPAGGMRFRQFVLSFWWNVAMRLNARLRNRMRGQPALPLVRTFANPSLAIAPESLRLPRSETPLVSVIIPTYGQFAFTANCLASIQAHSPAIPIEIIVVDDAYSGPDARAAVLRRRHPVAAKRDQSRLHPFLQRRRTSRPAANSCCS